MRRFVALFLVLLIVVPAAVASAARRPEAELCVVVVGAPDDVSADELTEGIVDGSYTIASVRPCSGVPRQGPTDGSGPTPAPTPEPLTTDTGQWIVDPIGRDPLTDQPVAATWVFADGSASVALIVECLGTGQTDVRIFWNAFLDLTAASITTRIDDQQPLTQGWPVDQDGTSSSYPTDPLAFLQDLLGRTRLVARATPWNEAPVTWVFPIAGIEAAVANVRTACGW